MEFGLSEEQTLLNDSVSRFLKDHASLDIVRKVAAGEQSDGRIWQGLTDLGIPALMIGEAAGGVNLGTMEAALIAETLGYHVTPGPYIPTAAIATTALKLAERTDILENIAAGTVRVGVAFSEAVGRRDKARVTSEGSKLNGTALFALDAEADFYLVATEQQSLFLVKADQIERRTLTTIDNTRSTCELKFNQTDADLISDDSAVYDRALDMGRIMLAADTLGAAQNMLDQAVAYAKQREQFDRPIATFQAVKHMCAEMAAQLEPCRSMVWYTAHAFDELPLETRLTACHTKAHISEVGKFVAKTATEVHGGMGFTDLVGLHYWFKRIGFNRQMLGSPELLREEAARLQGLVA